MTNEKKFIGNKKVEREFEIPTLISSWSNHYNSWKKIIENNLLIKYEDLLKEDHYEFYKIVDFLQTDLKKN